MNLEDLAKIVGEYRDVSHEAIVEGLRKPIREMSSICASQFLQASISENHERLDTHSMVFDSRAAIKRINTMIHTIK